LFVALAPVTRLDHISSSLIKDLDWFTKAIIWVTNTLGIYEVFGDTPTKELEKLVCGMTPFLCRFGMGFVDNTNIDLDDPDRL